MYMHVLTCSTHHAHWECIIFHIITSTARRVFSKVPGWDFAPFATLVWSECCSIPDKASICAKLDMGIGRQIWEIFLYLDTDSQAKNHIDDLCDLIQRVLRENGHAESEQNIKEWFCDETLIDFWSFFTAIVENYARLLKVREREREREREKEREGWREEERGRERGERGRGRGRGRERRGEGGREGERKGERGRETL